MAKRGFKVIDSELHLEEPFDLWERDLPEPFRSRTKITPTPRGHLDTGQAGIDLAGKGYSPGATGAEPTNGASALTGLIQLWAAQARKMYSVLASAFQILKGVTAWCTASGHWWSAYS